MDAAAIVAKDLIDHKAVKISIDPPFTWASGIQSPIYCDNRMMIAHPEARATIVSEFMVHIDHMKPDVIAGTATAGIPWAAFVAYQMKLPMVYVRPKAKEHGAGKQIEGYLEPNKKVVLVEDLISTGGSSIRAAEALKTEGKAIVQDVVAIVTYEMQRAKDAFAEAGINLTTLTDFSHLLKEANKQGTLTGEQIATVMEFSMDPAGWWENFQQQ